MLRVLFPLFLALAGIAMVIMAIDAPTMVRANACPTGTVALRDASNIIHCVVVRN